MKLGKKPRPATKYSLTAAKLLLESGDIDGRSAIARTLADTRARLAASLGGEATLSEQQAIIIRVAARTVLLLESLDNSLFSLGSLVNRKRRQCYPIIEQRARVADSLLRQLQALGLRRQAGPQETLSAYIERVKTENASPVAPESQSDSSADAEATLP
jgi:hypothetical protein